MSQFVYRPGTRGAVLCIQYGEDPPLPLYHGPRLDPALAHPFFPGTVHHVGARHYLDPPPGLRAPRYGLDEHGRPSVLR